MPERPNLPKKGSAARKIYDCIERVGDGLTAFEIERACGMIRNQKTHIASLADKGFIAITGKRDIEGVKNLDVWEVKKPGAPAQKKAPGPGRSSKQDLDPYECPACGKTIYLLLDDGRHGGECIEVEMQRRLVVFDGPWVKGKYTDPETGEEGEGLLPKNPFTLFEEWTGKLVVGREATGNEKAYYAEHKKLRKPWTIGFEGHLKTCKGWKRWLNGKAEEKRRTYEVQWDKKKKRYGFSKMDDTPAKTMTGGDGGD